MTLPTAKITEMFLPAYKAVLWDMDGTLVDTEPLHKRSLQIIGNEIGFPVSDALCLRAQGVGYRFAYDTMENEFGKMPISFDIWLEKMIATYLSLAAEIEPRPQAVEAVRYFQRHKIKQAVFSNSPRRIVEANAKGFLRFFDKPTDIFTAIVTLDDVSRPKPEPDGYIVAAAKLGLEPEDCLVIEDTPTGVKAGKASGGFTIYWPQSDSKVLNVQPDLKVDDLLAVLV